MNVFKTGIVQQRRRESYKEGGTAYPRVHGLVYAPGERELAVNHVATRSIRVRPECGVQVLLLHTTWRVMKAHADFFVSCIFCCLAR